MKDSQKGLSALVEVTPALPEEEPILANLLELYAYDFSEFIDLELGADGRFGYKSLPLYWRESARHPFLVRVNGNLAGFVFVRRGSQVSESRYVWDMTEFFIVRGYRRLGIGMKVTQDIWNRLPGMWEVRVTDRNRKAKEFWARAVSEFIGEAIEPNTFEKDGKLWHVYSFESKPRPDPGATVCP